MRENTFTRRNHWKQPPRRFMKMVLKRLEEGVLTIEKLQFYYELRHGYFRKM